MQIEAIILSWIHVGLEHDRLIEHRSQNSSLDVEQVLQIKCRGNDVDRLRGLLTQLGHSVVSIVITT